MEENKTQATEPVVVRKPFPTWGDIFAILGILVASQVLVAILVGILSLILNVGMDTIKSDPILMGRMMGVTYLCMSVVALWIILIYRRRRGATGPIAQWSLRGLNPVLILWAFALMIALNVVLDPLTSLLPGPSEAQFGRGLWTVLALVVFAPLFEEVVNRGIVLGALRSKYGVMVAWLGSSLFFGVIHGYPSQVVGAFVAGLVLAYVYIVTESLWAVIILHALNNALAYMLMTFFPENPDITFMEFIGNRTLYVVIYIGALALAGVSGYMTWRTLTRLKAEEKNSQQA